MNKGIKRILYGLTAAALIISVSFNSYFYQLIHQLAQTEGKEENGGNEEEEDIWNINYPDANSRDTYFSIHHVKQAQEISKGKGVKVGILDWCFGYEEHQGLYAGGKDFAKWEYHDENFRHASEHGYWMAQTLKEIAPEAEIYALGTYTPDQPGQEDEWVDCMIDAIKWAEEKEIDILTLSHEAVSERNRERFDEAVNEAVSHGIVTTFIHYDNPNNLLPWGIWSSDGDGYYKRSPDINIFQYDYNTVFLNNYGQIMDDEDFNTKYKESLHLSVSSMSVVTAGFVAILKGIDNTLSPAEYKEILIRTSRSMEYENEKAEHVADIAQAAQYLLGNRLADKNGVITYNEVTFNCDYEGNNTLLLTFTN